MEELQNGAGRIVSVGGRTIEFDLLDCTISRRSAGDSTVEIKGRLTRETPPKAFSFNFDDLFPKDSSLAPLFGFKRDERPPKAWEIDHIIKSGPATIVFWADGTKTMVRRAPDEEDNDYAAFTAALGIKLFGSNSALKRAIKASTKVQKPKAKKSSGECADTCPIDYDKIELDLAAVVEAKTAYDAGKAMANALSYKDYADQEPPAASYAEETERDIAEMQMDLVTDAIEDKFRKHQAVKAVEEAFGASGGR